MNLELIKTLKSFWGNENNIKDADPKDIQQDILSYLTIIESYLKSSKGDE